MTFQDFLEKYNGKYIDLDHAYGAQCMDLMHLYVVEVLGLNNTGILAAPAAKDVYNNFSNLTGHDNFEKIANTPTGIPQEGDIVLFGLGQFGHVCVFIEGNENKFTSFDQNYPTGSPCHVQSHTYTGCLGWLHYKQSLPQSDELNNCKTQLSDEIKKKNTLWNELQEVKTELEASQSEITSHKNFQTQLAITLKTDDQPTAIMGQITKLLSEEDQLTKFQRDNADLKTQVQNITNMLDEKTGQWIDTTKELTARENDIQALTRTLEQTKNDLSTCQQNMKIKFTKLFWNLYIGEVKK